MSTSATFRVLALLSLTVALTACGGSAEDGAASSQPQAAAGQAVAVTIDNLEFTPTNLDVPAGTEVTWTNDDEAPHTVTFSADGVDDSDELTTGDAFTATFDQAGTFDYICALHPDMTGRVTVT